MVVLHKVYTSYVCVNMLTYAVCMNINEAVVVVLLKHCGGGVTAAVCAGVNVFLSCERLAVSSILAVSSFFSVCSAQIL